MLPRRFALLGLAAVAAVPAQAHPHGALDAERHGDIERQIMAFRAALKDAAAAKDIVALRRMYAEGFTHTHGSGKMDGKDTRIVALLAGEPGIETAPAGELAFRVHGPDMVILTGRSPILNKTEGRDYDFRWMQVYSRASGDWQLAASQPTRLPLTT
jgi:Domain of unknown function (DUF4440)